MNDLFGIDMTYCNNKQCPLSCRRKTTQKNKDIAVVYRNFAFVSDSGKVTCEMRIKK